jgi:hypothetical protein
MTFRNLIGETFQSRLVIARLPNNKHQQVVWLCRCLLCGKEQAVVTGHLTSTNHPRHCSCARKGHVGMIHGDHGSPEYRTWQSMLNRCRNSSLRGWKDYGGRGLRVCERWHIYENFLADMGRRPNLNHSIERINNALGYFPGNCKWATRSEQQRNKRPKWNGFGKCGHTLDGLEKATGKRYCKACRYQSILRWLRAHRHVA